MGISLGRRRFLLAVGGAAAYAVLRPHRSWARKIRRAIPPLQPWTVPADPPSHSVELARAVIGAGVLAPSNWNSQPWRMEVDVNTIRLVADFTRSLPVTDPDQRGMMISLGAALENMLIAMRSYGMRTTVNYFPHGRSTGPVAEVAWSSGDLRRDRPMFAAIPERRTCRTNYDGRGIFMQNRATLSAQIPEDLAILWLDDRKAIRGVADLAHDATHDLVRDPAAQAERLGWMRFGDDQVRRRGDGVTVDAMEFSGPARWFAGKYFDPTSWFIRYGAGSAAKQARETIRSSGALALLASPGRGEARWLAAGQAYERFALKATQLGIAHQPVNAPIERERYRAELLRRFGAGAAEPLMLVRLGHCKQPRASARRAVAMVASFRSS